MKIGVLVKSVIVPADVTVGEDGSAHLPDDRAMNTFDAYGVSEAIELKQAAGGTVTAIGAGHGVRDVLTRALATGADDAIEVDLDVSGLDALSTARVLADAIRDRQFDLLIAGQTADDTEVGQVGIAVAELLGIPHVSCVVDIVDDGDRLRVQRDWEGSTHTLLVPKPAMMVMLTGRNAPAHHPSLRGMMQAKKRPVETLALDCRKSQLTWSAPVLLDEKPAGVVIDGSDPADAAARLIRWMREQRLIAGGAR